METSNSSYYPSTYAIKGVIYGAAVGDALGVPYEFKDRGTFKCTGMSEGGTHGMPQGTFSDDTSLLLATQDSLVHCGKKHQGYARAFSFMAL